MPLPSPRRPQTGVARIAFGIALVALTGCGETDPATPPAYQLTAPVRVVEDTFGIPHIYGQTDNDVMHAQGYVVAGLRPAQAETYRLRSQGRRGEIYGEQTWTEDLFLRAMNFPGFAREHWPTLLREHREVAEGFAAFAAGINRRYAEYRREGWPRTLQVLVDAGYAPPDWTAIDVFALSQLLGFGLSGSPNLKIEVSVALALLGPDLFADMFRFRPPGGVYPIPDWYERAGIRAAPAATPGGLQPTRVALPELTAALGEPDSGAGLALMDAVRALRGIDMGGSNHFAVAGDRMANGVAVLSSDTHEGVAIPGPYYLAHLISNRDGARGTQDMIGAAFAGAPTVVFGHNGHVAWAPTIGYIDITDFYLEVADPDRPGHVLRPGGRSLPTTTRWESFRVRQADGSFRHETVEIRDITGHGPILPAEMLPLPVPLRLSVRWAGAQVPGPTEAILKLSRTRTMDEMFGALRHMLGATIGFGLATTENRIAMSHWTRLPRRNVTGTFKPWFIIPGQFGPHWDGFVPYEEVPYLIDPDHGYVWSANNDPVGDTDDGILDNSPHYYGYVYSLGYRGRRIDGVLRELTERGDVTAAEVEALLLDRTSTQADDLLPYLFEAAARRPDLVDAEIAPFLATLADWDRVAAGDSTAATIFVPWTFQFTADFLLDEVDLFTSLSGGDMQIFGRAVVHWLDRTADIIDGIDAGTIPFPSATGRNYFDKRGTTDVVETRDELLLEALRTTVRHLRRVTAEGTHGEVRVDPDDPATWHWEHFVWRRIRHDLVNVDPEWRRYTQFFPTAGHYDTPNVGNYLGYSDGKLVDRFVLNNQASNRWLWEMHPDGIRARFQVPWGQSEDPESPHFIDLLEHYQNEVWHDFPYRDDEIAAVQAREWVLRP